MVANGIFTRVWRAGMLAAALLPCDGAMTRELGLPTVNAPAPNFRVTTFDGRKLTLADFKGQVVIVNFWATWCGPCKRELPLLEGYYRARQDAGLRIVAVTTENSLSPAQLAPLQKQLTLPLAHNFRGDYGDIKALPTNFVIDRNGILRYAHAGAFELDSLNEVLTPLLAEPVP